jgi:hypothetical protein
VDSEPSAPLTQCQDSPKAYPSSSHQSFAFSDSVSVSEEQYTNPGFTQSYGSNASQVFSEGLATGHCSFDTESAKMPHTKVNTYDSGFSESAVVEGECTPSLQCSLVSVTALQGNSSDSVSSTSHVEVLPSSVATSRVEIHGILEDDISSQAQSELQTSVFVAQAKTEAAVKNDQKKTATGGSLKADIHSSSTASCKETIVSKDHLLLNTSLQAPQIEPNYTDDCLIIGFTQSSSAETNDSARIHSTSDRAKSCPTRKRRRVQAIVIEPGNPSESDDEVVEVS